MKDLATLKTKYVLYFEAVPIQKYAAQHNRMRNRIKLPNIGITTSGTYKYKLYQKKKNAKDEFMAMIPLDFSIYINGQQV